jgi:hypothetical protein
MMEGRQVSQPKKIPEVIATIEIPKIVEEIVEDAVMEDVVVDAVMEEIVEDDVMEEEKLIEVELPAIEESLVGIERMVQMRDEPVSFSHAEVQVEIAKPIFIE